ncbi:conserved domain protein [ [[Propionibacterium] namnetense SK182B-JCVI]|uniref:Conserved domain protein n=1 Tax=[Propionibacterium] namnetense SK182B-JCVI TaxID=1051006 RepID=F9NY32_9ACTN|nr:conserved domain protein [ [[Propionibacterium] namnetense SK182B-JCVI]
MAGQFCFCDDVRRSIDAGACEASQGRGSSGAQPSATAAWPYDIARSLLEAGGL